MWPSALEPGKWSSVTCNVGYTHSNDGYVKNANSKFKAISYFGDSIAVGRVEGKYDSFGEQ